MDAFTDLLLDINECPPGTPITVEWNSNLTHYDSTRDTQVFKAFTDLPKDLAFVYGSLTVSRSSFRPWLGPKNSVAFLVPGMEFFATTGEYKNETEWRNPAGRWLRQIIPKGDQIPKFLDELAKMCYEDNKDLPAEKIQEDDSFEGRLTLSTKGVHFAETEFSLYGWVATGFKEDLFLTDLTQAIQSTEALHTSIPCNSATHKVITSGETGACTGQMASVCNLKILPDTAGNAAGQAAPLRRVPGFTEPLKDLAPVARSSPRRDAAFPSPLLAGKHVSFFGKFFRQILPLSIRYTPMSGTPSFIHAPGHHTAGVSGPQPRAAPKYFVRAEESALGASLNAQSQAQDIPGVSSRADFLRHTPSSQAQSKAPDIISLRAYSEQLLGSLNAQDQAPDDPLSLRAYLEMLWASFHAQDRQCDPYIFVVYFHHGRQEPGRLPTTQDSLFLSLQQVSQDRAQELFARHLTRPYQGVSRIEFFVCYLWIPVVRQGVVCFHSGGLRCSSIFTAIVFNDPCGSSLFVSMYLSLAFSLRRSA